MAGSRFFTVKDCNSFTLLWVEASDRTSIALSVTDGRTVWHGQINSSLKPKNQSALSNDEYLRSISDALSQEDASQYALDIDATGDAAIFTVKKNIAGSTSQLMWCKSALQCDTAASAVLEFTSALVHQNNSLRCSVQDLSAVNTSLRDDLQTLAADTESLKKEYDESTQVILTKTCLLLNAKKLEIARLQREMEALSASVLPEDAHTETRAKPAAKRRKVEKVKKDESDAESMDIRRSSEDTDEEGKKRAKKQAPARARSIRSSRAVKPDRKLVPLENTEEDNIFAMGKSGSMEINGADIDAVLSQPSTARILSTKSGSCSRQPADDSESSQQGIPVIITQSQASNASASGSGASKKASNKVNSLKNLIDSDDDDDVMSCLY